MQHTGAQPRFEVLVANFTGAHDSLGNPVKSRSTFTQQSLSTNDAKWGLGLITSTAAAPATATLTVADNDFSTGALEVYLGDYIMVSDVHFVVGAAAADTAHNLAAAITNLPEFNATHLLEVVTIEGPSGPDGASVVLKVVHRGTILNATCTVFSIGQPRLGPPILT